LIYEILNEPLEALKNYDYATDLDPQYQIVYWNKAITLLRMGELFEGWKLYEKRWAHEEFIVNKRSFKQPLWLGQESLEGKTILLYSEQGLGDTLQFCRYAELVHARGAKVILEVPKFMIQVLEGLRGVERFVAKGDALPDFDFQCPLMSLPLAFKTSLETIPANVPYLFTRQERVQRWAKHIGSEGFKIGIGWQGSTHGRVDVGRSFHLSLFEQIAKIEGVRLISLQKNTGTEQLQNLPAGMHIETLPQDFDAGDGAFLDSAAVMKCLDLVISSDTALTHLAGALGVKTWLPLKYVPDWRWMMERQDSPWYPSHRLFRQKSLGDWQGVFQEIDGELRTIVIQANVGPIHTVKQGLVLHQEGNLIEAKKIYENVLNQNPNNPDALHLLGVIYYQNGNFKNAIKLIKKSLTLNPSSEVAYTNLGNSYKEIKQYSEAIKSYRAAIRINKNNFQVHINYGLIFYELKKYNSSLAKYKMAISINPENPVVYYVIGNSLQGLGKYKEAIKKYEKAIEKKFDYYQAYGNMGHAYQQIKE
jgi:tetratricopeptide (TPR) repeat protein